MVGRCATATLFCGVPVTVGMATNCSTVKVKFRLSSFGLLATSTQSIGSLNAATRFPSRCRRRQSWSWRASRQERPASEDLESHAKQMQLPRDETAIAFLISSSPLSLAGTWDGPGRAGLDRSPILVPRKAGPSLLQTRVPFMAGPGLVSALKGEASRYFNRSLTNKVGGLTTHEIFRFYWLYHVGRHLGVVS